VSLVYLVYLVVLALLIILPLLRLVPLHLTLPLSMFPLGRIPVDMSMVMGVVMGMVVWTTHANHILAGFCSAFVLTRRVVVVISHPIIGGKTVYHRIATIGEKSFIVSASIVITSTINIVKNFRWVTA
jgi:hypothetical protein